MDRELMDALSVIARRMGLIERGQRLVIEGDPRDAVWREGAEPAPRDESLCLAYGKHREVRLLCTYAAGHDRACSWVGAMIGKSPCTAEYNIGGMVWTQCERPTNHTGEHEATAPDGVRWTWGDAPTVLAPSEKYRCKARAQHENGAYFVCQLVNGHGGDHRHQVTGGEAHTWPDVIREKHGAETRVIDPTEPRA